MGVGICWNQWFLESACCMALLGVEILSNSNRNRTNFACRQQGTLGKVYGKGMQQQT